MWRRQPRLTPGNSELKAQMSDSNQGAECCEEDGRVRGIRETLGYGREEVTAGWGSMDLRVTLTKAVSASGGDGVPNTSELERAGGEDLAMAVMAG